MQTKTNFQFTQENAKGIISKLRPVGPLQEIKIDSKPVQIVSHCKCLGVSIDQDLSWHQHVKETCNSFSAKLKKLSY